MKILTTDAKLFRVLWVIALERQTGSPWLRTDDIFARAGIPDMAELEVVLKAAVKKGYLKEKEGRYGLTARGLIWLAQNFNRYDHDKISSEMQNWVEKHVTPVESAGWSQLCRWS
jgi:hypothetical protein